MLPVGFCPWTITVMMYACPAAVVQPVPVTAVLCPGESGLSTTVNVQSMADAVVVSKALISVEPLARVQEFVPSFFTVSAPVPEPEMDASVMVACRLAETVAAFEKNAL